MSSHDYDEIIDRVDKAALIAEYDPGTIDKGDYWLFACPACGKREAWWYKNSHGYKCNRLSKCGHTGTINDMIALVDHVDSTDAKEVYIALKKRAGMWEENNVVRLTVVNAWKTVAEYCQQILLNEDRAAPVRDYLRGRGYTTQQVADMKLGYMPQWSELNTYLAGIGYKKADLDALGLKRQEFGTSHVLLIPYRCYDEVRGVIVRTIGAHEPKYYYNNDLKLKSPFGIRKAQAGSLSPLVIVEGWFDALLLQQNGVKNAVAVGGASFTQTMIDDAVSRGHRRFILCLDNDVAGVSGMSRAVVALCKQGYEVYVALWSNGAKDPDEQLRTQDGRKFLLDAIRDAQRGSRWLARNRVESVKMSDMTDVIADELMEQAIRDALTFRDIHDKRIMVEETGKALFLNDKEIAQRWTRYVDREREIRLAESRDTQLDDAKAQIDKMLTAINAKDIDMLRDIVHESDNRLTSAKKESYIIVPTLESVRSEIMRSGNGIRSGYDEIDSVTRIPSSAVTTFLARPGHCKTQMLLNMYRNALLDPENVGKMFIYWTLEENALSSTAPKIISILSAETQDVRPFDQNSHLWHLRYYLSHFENMQKITDEAKKAKWLLPNINRGIELYRDLVSTNRLLLGDRVKTTGQMRSVIEESMNVYDMPVGGIFLDYIQKAKAETEMEIAVRQVMLQKVSEEFLQLSKDYAIPAVSAGQFARGEKGAAKNAKDSVMRADNARESGDVEQDSAMIFGIWNPAMAPGISNDDPVRQSRYVSLEINCLKARESSMQQKGEFTLKLDRYYGKIWGRSVPVQNDDDDENPFIRNGA